MQKWSFSLVFWILRLFQELLKEEEEFLSVSDAQLTT